MCAKTTRCKSETSLAQNSKAGCGLLVAQGTHPRNFLDAITTIYNRVAKRSGPWRRLKGRRIYARSPKAISGATANCLAHD